MVRDLHLHNSSDWTFRMDNSHDIFVDNVDIYGDERFPNNDGFDPESCTNVTLVNSRINVGDDGVCPKAGPAGPTALITVRNTTIRSKSGVVPCSFTHCLAEGQNHVAFFSSETIDCGMAPCSQLALLCRSNQNWFQYR